MEATTPDHPSQTLAEDGIDPPAEPTVPDHDSSAEAESLRESYHALLSKASEIEESLLLRGQERDEALKINASLRETIGELSRERDSFRLKLEELEVSYKAKEEELAQRIAEVSTQNDDITKLLEYSRKRIDELESECKETNGFLVKSLDPIRYAQQNLIKLIERLNDERVVIDGVGNENGEVKDEGETRELWREIAEVLKLAVEADSKVEKYKEAREKEKKELENSVVSLTEENRDINSLFRVALVEKETVEKNLNKLKGNNEQKRVPLLQLGLQRVGFGFMMGSGLNEQPMVESTASGSKSDGSESEEEVVTLASTVERMMKNLRLEISQLRRSLEESRSDTERLQSLTQQQAQEMEENKLYIRELEDRERIMAQNVEELLVEIKETEADVARWREACELEVEAGNKEIEERDKVASILKQELEKTRAALDISNGKLKLKEDLAAAAMAAQAAAERSLQLADSRTAGLNERIEELTKQLDEAEKKERSRRKETQE